MKWKPGQAVRIETENYFLRSLRAPDVTDRFVSWFGDHEVMEYVAMPMNLSRNKINGLISRFDNKSNFIFGVFTKESSLCIGFFRVYCNHRNRSARTAVVIGEREFWGRKVVLEARAGVLAFLFDTLSLNKVWGTVYTRNLPAVFNYKAQGFQCEGILRQEGRARDGSWRDIYRFAMLRDEWLERQKATDQ